MENQNKVLLSIVEFLHSIKTQDGVDSSNVESAIGIISKEFKLDDSPETFKQNSYYPVGLGDVFEAGIKALGAKNYDDAFAEAKSNSKYQSFVDVVVNKGYFNGAEEGSLEYLKRHAKLLNKFKEKSANAAPSKVELESQAEEFKNKGNIAINAKKYDEAVEHYTQALKLSSDGPNSHVYYSNRAAAHCYANRYQDAVDDCHACLALSPDYVKAYSRLGLANFFLENFEEAVSAYERAVELEPDNKQSQDSLRQAKNKLKKKQSTTVPSSSSSSGSSGGMPDLASLMGGAGGGGAGGAGLAGLMNNPAMKSAVDQMGGPGAVANMMKDPQMMAMAQQMMKDPAMMQQAMQMMSSMGLGGGGGAGGLPDMSALLGGAGGGNNNNTVPSSSSSSKNKKPFKGFEE